MGQYKKEYMDMLEERVRRELESDITALMMTLSYALADLKQGSYPNSCGIVQGSASNIDKACVNLSTIREVKELLTAERNK